MRITASWFGSNGPTEYKHAGATVALTRRAPLGSMQSSAPCGAKGLLFPFFGGVIVANEVEQGANHRLTGKAPYKRYAMSRDTTVIAVASA